MIDFCFDNFKPVTCEPWPNLVPIDYDQIEISTLGRVLVNGAHWGSTPPWSSDPMLIKYLKMLGMDYTIWDTASAPNGSFYLIDLTLFDMSDFDYFAHLSEQALCRLRRREIKILITYGEADETAFMQDKIFDLCDRYNINPVDVLVTMGSSTVATTPSNFYHLNEDYFSYFYDQKSRQSEPLTWHGRPRSKNMTVLCRVHKDWRAYFSSDFWHKQYHKHSYFSYNLVDYQDSMSVDQGTSTLDFYYETHPHRQKLTQDFLNACPFVADHLDAMDHNAHYTRIDEHFTDSYWNLVLETRIELANNSPGVFITEKTWKPIANAQPFIIVGNRHSLQYLRNLGYRTFYEIGIDESYDDIQDPVERMNCVADLVDRLFSSPTPVKKEVIHNAREIVEHNQKLFWSGARDRMQDFINQILNGKATRTDH